MLQWELRQGPLLGQLEQLGLEPQRLTGVLGELVLLIVVLRLQERP